MTSGNTSTQPPPTESARSHDGPIIPPQSSGSPSTIEARNTLDSKIGDASLTEFDAVDDAVGEILEGYFERLREGNAESAEQLLDDHPDHADALKECLDGLAVLNPAVERVDQIAGVQTLSEGTVLGDFIIEQEIGRGAMGIVYRAAQQSTQRRVAVKVMSGSVGASEKRRLRFQREAQAAAAVDHAHSIPIYVVQCTGEIAYMAMRWIEGFALSDSERRDRFFSLQSGRERFRRIARCFAGAVDAVAAAHDLGIVHRDIKPSNLLLDTTGKLWVSDFGLASLEQVSDLTATGELVGTLAYMSPEQVSGRPDRVDGSSDVYSLGATLYEVVSGQRVYAGLNGVELIEAIRKHPPASIYSVEPGIDRDLATIIERALRPEKIDRYESAKHLADDLRRFANGTSILARPVTMTERVLGWAKNHAKTVVVSLLALFVISTAALVYGQALAYQKREAQNTLQIRRQNLKDARDLVGRFAVGFSDRLRGIPAAAEIRRDMLSDAIHYYQEFIARSKSDPGLTLDVARARIEMAQQIALIGDNVEADYQFSLALNTLLSESDPAAQRLAFFALGEQAMLRSEAGDHPTALEILDRRKSVKNPFADRSQTLTTLDSSQRAIVLTRLDNHDAARPLVSQVLQYCRETTLPKSDDVTSSAGEHERLESAFVASIIELSATLSETKRLDDAYKVTRAIADWLGQGTGKDTKRQWAIVQSNVGAICMHKKDHRGALESFSAARTTLETLRETNPHDLGLRQDLSVAMSNQAMAMAASGQERSAKLTLIAAKKLLLSPTQPSTRSQDTLKTIEANLDQLSQP